MEMEMEMEMEVEVFGAMSPMSSSAVTAAAAAAATASEDEGDLRRGPWTVEEDMLLVDYIAKHGEGRWNSLARCAGLKRTGKSCRLRWLNYLRPDVRRGNITPEEQLLILELHSRWGNRWSKIAQHLPGRTDNEIKNYWRTRVQKHAKQLRCEINSKQFRDVVRHIWMPRLVERIQADSAAAATAADVPVPEPVPAARTMSSPVAPLTKVNGRHHVDYYTSNDSEPSQTAVATSPDITSTFRPPSSSASHGGHLMLSYAGTAASTTNNAAGTVAQCASGGEACDDVINDDSFSGSWSELLAATGLPEFEFGDFDDSLWGLEDICYSSSADERGV